VPQSDRRFDEFYLGDHLYEVVLAEEKRYQSQPRDPNRGRFAEIRAELVIVFPVTDLFCHLHAAYAQFGFEHAPETPQSIMRRQFGWKVQSFLEWKLKDRIARNWQLGGLEDWDYAIVGIPDALCWTRRRRLVLVDWKGRGDFPFRTMTRKGIPANLQKSRFYPPKPHEWKQMQLLLYLLRKDNVQEYEGQPIRYAIIISVDPRFNIKHSFVAFDERWVKEELGRVRELRQACFEIKLKAGDNITKAKELIETDPRIRPLPLASDEHSWCAFRHICPVGIQYRQAIAQGEHKTPEWIKAKKRREARIRKEQLPEEVRGVEEEKTPQQIFLLDPKDPGVLQVKDRRKARVIRLGGLPPTS